MTEILSKISVPVAKEMSQFNDIFSDSLSHTDGLLNQVLKHILQRGGKRMRPLLTLLIAKSLYMNQHGDLYKDFQKVKHIFNGDVKKSPFYKTLCSAASLELLHTATLVHDDVVDEADKRRGQSSVNATFNNNLAVLVGDYILSTSLDQIAKTQNFSMIQVIIDLGKTLSEGEVKQQQIITADAFSIDAYYDVISKKTAALFESCCSMGALSVSASEEEKEKARLFGHNIGIIFQIRDDIFDYYDSQEIGKPTGNDMREGKLTLPVLFVLNDKDNPCPENITNIAHKVKELEATHEEIQTLIQYTKDHGGINFARQAMDDYYKLATSYIDESVSDPAFKEALTAYADYVIGRDI